MEATLPVWARRARARQGEKGNTVASGSPPVATARVGGAVVVAALVGWGEDKIGGAGGSPPVAPALVVAAGAGVGAGEGVQPSTAGAAGGSQNCTSVPLALRTTGREEANAFHSAWQAGVMSSPFQLDGMRSPAAVQPGQDPQTKW